MIDVESCWPFAVEVCVCMKQQYLITHYYHSGFSVAGMDTLLVFDYWRGEKGELTPDLCLTPVMLRQFRNVFVFISHEHPDHLDPVVFTWNDLGNVTYIVSSDMPVGTRGKRMAPGDTHRFSDEVTVTAFDSTDLGVSFLVDFLGTRFFHAGDLNFWHWREESTMQEIDEADQEFRKAVRPLLSEKIDVAFFPVDPRQGTMFEAGANYFILSVKPRILIPMHYFHRSDTATEYARTAGCSTTEVLALPGYGDQVRMDADDEHYLNLSFPETRLLKPAEPPEEELPAESAFLPETSSDAEKPLGDAESILSEDDPFLESDLPLTSLANPAPDGGE